MATNNPATRGWGDPSASGYSKSITTVEVDGAKFRVHKKVAPIFDMFLTRLVLENDYDLGDSADDWSFAFRPIRGYEDDWRSTHNFKYLSNHSWGLAVDVNALRNPMSKRLITNMPKDWIHKNAPAYMIGWGGDYAGRKDAMHFEFMGTPKDAARIIDRINTRKARTMATLDAEDLANIGKTVDTVVRKHVSTILGNPGPEDDDKTHNSLADVVRLLKDKA